MNQVKSVPRITQSL